MKNIFFTLTIYFKVNIHITKYYVNILSVSVPVAVINIEQSVAKKITLVVWDYLFIFIFIISGFYLLRCNYHSLRGTVW